MATSTLPGPFAPDWTSRATESAAAVRAWDLLRAAGSLKITVVMFLAATFLLFVGTLAQDEKNLPEVKAEYFNSWIARIPFSDFFPVTIFGESRLTGWFPFPGGATIGIVLLANLVAAKVTRFHVSGRGRRLFWGTLVSLLGGLLALAVILTGHRSDGLQGRPPIEYETVWRILQATAAIGTLVLIAAAVRGHSRRLVRLGLAGAAAVAAVSTALMLFGGDDWRMNEPGLRIMWQLMQSSAASLVLLAGLVMVFGHRGGNVLIHLAVGLLMVGQFVFGDRQIEERMTLVEGQSTNMACRIDETELAIATAAEVPPAPAPQTSGGEGRQERVTAISGRLLAARARGEPIRLDDLPFDIHVLDYFANSGLGRGGSGQDGDAANPATAGIGTRVQASARPPEGGASSRTNIASAYIRLVEREGGRDLGTHLVTQFLNDQSQLFMATAADECDTVTSGGREWRMQLRFRREYKPYAVTLDDVRRIDYSASDTPRDYSSYVTFSDPASGEEQKGRIWMNNPVRYRGETFYQSQYSEVDLGGGRKGEQTGLQVVENAGWLVPYVACVLAFWGMLAHFGRHVPPVRRPPRTRRGGRPGEVDAGRPPGDGAGARPRGAGGAAAARRPAAPARRVRVADGRHPAGDA